MDRHRTLADVESGLRIPLTDAMETQRAIRRLLPDPVDDAIVLRCVELALKAPTGSNAQNWEWVLVKDRKAKETLATRYREAWLLYGTAARVASRRDRRARRIVDAVQWQVDHFAEFPVLVVACLRGGRPPLIPLPSIAESSFYGSIYPAVQNLLLAARAMGLGAALVTMPLWNVISVRRALGLPVSVTPCCVIPMGWPRGRYGPTTRKPVGHVVHLDHFGNRPWRSTGGARHPDAD